MKHCHRYEQIDTFSPARLSKHSKVVKNLFRVQIAQLHKDPAEHAWRLHLGLTLPASEHVCVCAHRRASQLPAARSGRVANRVSDFCLSRAATSMHKHTLSCLLGPGTQAGQRVCCKTAHGAALAQHQVSVQQHFKLNFRWCFWRCLNTRIHSLYRISTQEGSRDMATLLADTGQ